MLLLIGLISKLRIIVLFTVTELFTLACYIELSLSLPEQ